MCCPLFYPLASACSQTPFMLERVGVWVHRHWGRGAADGHCQGSHLRGFVQEEPVGGQQRAAPAEGWRRGGVGWAGVCAFAGCWCLWHDPSPLVPPRSTTTLTPCPPSSPACLPHKPLSSRNCSSMLLQQPHLPPCTPPTRKFFGSGSRLPASSCFVWRAVSEMLAGYVHNVFVCVVVVKVVVPSADCWFPACQPVLAACTPWLCCCCCCCSGFAFVILLRCGAVRVGVPSVQLLQESAPCGPQRLRCVHAVDPPHRYAATVCGPATPLV